jgi:tetratricopeptide (TPR) repeat protein
LALSGDSSDAATRLTGVGGVETSKPVSEDSALPAGTRVDRYMIVDVLGTGGMGVVYRAFDPDLDRPLAIKLVRPMVAAGLSSGGADRLLREAQALARLSHPNVVAVYDVGTYDGQVFLAMEMIDGEDLKTWLRLGEQVAGRPWKEILKLFIAAGRGLAAAHARGLVHRDFKPRNVLIGHDGRVRVVDFGLARLGEGGGASDELTSREGVNLSSDLTGVGGVVGTPLYMAPEQWLGETVDAKSDQFSFCVALYQALYRQLPFEGEDESSYHADMMAGHVRETEVAGVPGWLRAAVIRGLQPEPEQRHDSMQLLLDDFDRRLRPRRWTWVGAFSLLLGAAVGAAAWASAAGPGICEDGTPKLEGTWNDSTRTQIHDSFSGSALPFAEQTFGHVERSLDQWATQWIERRRESCEATHVRGEQTREVYELRAQCYDDRFAELVALVDLFSSADAGVVEKAADAVDSLSRLDACGDPDRLRAGVAPPTDPQVRVAVNELRAELAKADKLARAGKKADALELVQTLRERSATVDYPPIQGELALAAAGLSDQPQAAHEAALEALDIAKRTGSDQLEVRAWTVLVRIVGYQQAKPELALEYADHAAAVLERIGDRPELLAALVFQRALVYDVKGEPGRAGEGYQRAYDLQLDLYGEDHLGLGNALNGLGIVEHMKGNDEQAVAYFQQALDLRTRIVGPIHPTVASAHSNIGAVLSRADDCKSAIVRYEKALQIYEAVRGPSHSDLATPLNNLGVCLQSEGRLEDARLHFERSLEMEVALSGPDHPNAAGVHINLGRLARQQTDHQRGLEHSQKAYQILAASFGEDHLDTAFAAFGVGAAKLSLGDAAGAIDPLELALRVRAQKDPVKGNVAEAQFALAQALFASGSDRSRARDLAGQARDGYAALGDSQASLVGEVQAWLDAHG